MSGKEVVSGGGAEWFRGEASHEELVAGFRRVLETARARHPTTSREPFNAAEWLGERLNQMAMSETQPPYRLAELSTAYDALAHARYTSGGGWYGEETRRRLSSYVQQGVPTSFTLPPQSVRYLDAMCAATGIPRQRGEATIDLTPFAPQNHSP